jgi:PKD repeat protein
LQNPVHMYKDIGQYEVSLTANGIKTTKSDYISVTSGCPNNHAKVGGTSSYYPTIHEVYEVLGDNEVAQMHAISFSETLLLDHTTIVKLQGGFDCGYVSNPGYSTVNGLLTIKGGKVTIDKLIIK